MKSIPIWLNILVSLFLGMKSMHGWILLSLEFDWIWYPIVQLWIYGILGLGFAFVCFIWIQKIRYKIID